MRPNDLDMRALLPPSPSLLISASAEGRDMASRARARGRAGFAFAAAAAAAAAIGNSGKNFNSCGRSCDDALLERRIGGWPKRRLGFHRRSLRAELKIRGGATKGGTSIRTQFARPSLCRALTSECLCRGV